MAHKTRDSTNSLYQGYWDKFSIWCSQRGANSHSPTVQLLADYLNYLFEVKHYKPKAIEGVKSCLSQAFILANVLDVTQNPQLSALLRNFSLTCPVERFTFPKWNLNLVLSMLLKPPYEPLCDIPLKELTLKTCFLLALSTAARCSELHALSYSLMSHSPGWTHVWLQPHVHFLAKNQSSREPGQQRCFKVQSLCDFAGPDLPDRKLCPVRALRLYLAKTQARRFKQKQRSLFISLRPSRGKEISKSAIAMWLRTVIRDAHKNCTDQDLDFARASVHEVRAIASSLAYSHSLSLTDIVSHCMWRSDSTFTSFYLRDVSRQFPDHIAFQPCVAAGKIVK